MRVFIIGLVVFLAACGGSSSVSGITQAQLDAAVKPLQAQVDTLQTQNKSLQDSIAKLTLIGKVHGVASSELRMQGEFRSEAVAAPNFGPCADMGVLEGTTFASGNGPLGAVYQAFKNCTNTHAEYAVDSGQLKIANRLYFTTPDCSGTAYIWQAGGQGYNSQTLNDGIVFVSPVNGQTLWVTPGQIPQMTQVQSAWLVINGDCEADGDLQQMWVASQNDISKTGVPDSVGKYQLAAP